MTLKYRDVIVLNCAALLVLWGTLKVTFAEDDFSAATKHQLRYQISKGLTDAGFENVAVEARDQFTFVAYENRIYRHEVRAIKAVLDTVASYLTAADDYVILVPRHRRIPLVFVAIRLGDYRGLVAGRLSSTAFASNVTISLQVEHAWWILARTSHTGSSLAKIDLVIHPKFSAQLGNYEDPLEARFSFVPEIQTSLWSGMRLSAQMIVPAYNELGAEKGRVRPYLISINQTLRLPIDTFVSASLGYFTQDRYGIDLEAKKYFANGLWAVGARFGYTGFANYERDTWFFSNFDQKVYFGNAEFRFPGTDLAVKASFGKYLYGDTGARIDFVRHFGEVDLGFFALLSQAGRNGGFTLSIPLFPRKYLPSHRIRISPSRAFAWEYRYRGLQNGALLYKTGNNLDDFMKRLYPDFLRNQFIEFGGWRK